MKKDSVESTKYGREKNSTLLSFRMFFSQIRTFEDQIRIFD